MRPATLAGIAVLALSTAAPAQVARTPVEQKNAPANAAAIDDTATGNDAPTNATAAPPDAKTEPATPPR